VKSALPLMQRYDLYRTSAALALFVLFEIYADQGALEAHRQTAHFAQLRVVASFPLLHQPETTPP
jgi:quinol monooxygenase YgiN